MHINSHLQASYAEYEAIKLSRKSDRNKDGLSIHSSEASVEFDKEGTVSRIPKAIDDALEKLTSNALTKSKDELEGEGKICSTKVPLGRTANMAALSCREQMKEIFKQHDSNNDGFLNIWEVTKAFAFLGSMVPFNKAHYGLNLADVNKDGLITEVELDKLLDYATKVMKNK